MKQVLISCALLAALGSVQAQPATYAVDPSHTFATFEISHLGASINRGRFDKKEGSVMLDKAAKTGRVELTIHVASVNTGLPQFDKHLQSADIFNVQAYPTATFVGDRFVFNGDKVASVSGQLTLMGKTAPVTFKANQFNCYEHPMLKRETCGGDFEATIDRTVYGLNYALNFGIPKEVRIVAQIEAIKQ